MTSSAEGAAAPLRAAHPVRFADIIGHEPALQRLRRALAAGRIANAYLFYGPDQVGKRAVASTLAAALVCPNRSGAQDACGHCPDCRACAAGTHPAVLHVGPSTEAGRITLQQVREMRRRLALTAEGRGWKAAVVDHADHLTLEAANALLKTLEEPPGPTVVVLVATDPGALPETVRSRCVRLYLGPVAAASLEQALVTRGEQPSQARRRAAAARGAPGRALGGGEALEDAWRRAQAWLKAATSGDTGAVDAHTKQAEAAALPEVDAAFSAMVWLWRDVAAWSWTRRLDLTAYPEAETVRALGSRVEPQEAALALERLLAARRMLLEFTRPRLVLNWALMSLRRATLSRSRGSGS